MAPFAASLLPAGLGLFWGAAGAALPPDRPGRASAGCWSSPARFALLEWLRGHVLTGFPWNLPGETWAAGSAVVAGRRRWSAPMA